MRNCKENLSHGDDEQRRHDNLFVKPKLWGIIKKLGDELHLGIIRIDVIRIQKYMLRVHGWRHNFPLQDAQSQR